MSRVVRATVALIALVAGTSSLQPVHADGAGLDCTLKFYLSTWSVVAKHSEGSGIVKCEDGATMRVHIVAKGASLAGKAHVDGGTGRFSPLRSLAEILGSYDGASDAKTTSSSDLVLTKGAVSLAIAGTGEGVDLRVDVGELTLTRGGK